MSDNLPEKPGKVKRSYRKKKSDGTALSPQRKDPLWKLLDEHVGGKEGLLSAALASSNPKCQELIPYLLDGNYKTWGTKALAAKVGLSAIEVVEMFRDRKWLEAYLRIHQELPDIVGDALTDAKASYVPCSDCKGKKVAESGEPCWVCRGKGEIRRQGDKDKLSFIGEASGMTGKGKGTTVNFNQQLNVGQGNSVTSFEDLVRRATVTVVKKIEAVKEAEVIEGER